MISCRQEKHQLKLGRLGLAPKELVGGTGVQVVVREISSKFASASGVRGVIEIMNSLKNSGARSFKVLFCLLSRWHTVAVRLGFEGGADLGRVERRRRTRKVKAKALRVHLRRKLKRPLQQQIPEPGSDALKLARVVDVRTCFMIVDRRGGGGTVRGLAGVRGAHDVAPKVDSIVPLDRQHRHLFEAAHSGEPCRRLGDEKKEKKL